MGRKKAPTKLMMGRAGPVFLPLGEDVGSRWPSKAGHGPWIATAESADDAFPLPLMDLNGGDSQGAKQDP